MGNLVMDDGTRLNYRLVGSGHPLVCIHGFGADGSAFRLTEKILSRDFTVVSVDLRGHGKTVLGSGGLGFKEMATDLEQLFEYLGLDRLTLMGWSMGGAVSLEYIRTIGLTRIRDLILVETSPRVINDNNWTYGLYCGGYTEKMALDDLSDIRIDYQGFVYRFMKRMAPNMDMENFQIMIESMNKNNPEVMASVWKSIITSDYREVLRGISIPSLVISGRDSTFYSEDAGRHIAGILSMGKHETIRGGHLAPIENPVDFNRVVRGFIADDNVNH